MPFCLPLKLYGKYSEEEILTTTLINVKSRQIRADSINSFLKLCLLYSVHLLGASLQVLILIWQCLQY